MKKLHKGFTLIELMIVVAIIGILAAIAIPNFLRYQLRSKASERKMNVDAIYKAEESGRQREGGAYKVMAATPAGTVGTGKKIWTATDYSVAGTIDWVVQGATYGQYAAAHTNGVALSVCGWTDIDGDAVLAGDALWQPLIKADGTMDAANAPPNAPCDNAVNKANHPALTFTFGTDQPGTPVQMSADAVF